MKRRTFIGVVAATIGIAGCSGESGRVSPTQGSTTEPTTHSPTAGPETADSGTASVDHLGRYRAFLLDNGIDVAGLSVTEGVVDLRYVTTEPSGTELGAEVGRISGGFFNGVDHGWDVGQLDATILDVESNEIGHWYARTEWFHRYQRGEIDGRELSLKVLDTVERTD